MFKSILALSIIFLLACSTPEPQIITVVATREPLPPTSTPLPTATVVPPNTPIPAPTSEPVIMPTNEPVSPIGIYTCTNLIHKSRISSSEGVTQFFFPLDIEIVTIYNIKELSKTFTLLECEAEAAVTIDKHIDKLFKVTYSIQVDSEGELTTLYRFD